MSRALRHSAARVLLVDDDQTFASDILDLLSPHFAISYAQNGEDALRFIDDLAPDVVLLDLQLGAGMNGFEVWTRSATGRWHLRS